VLRPGPYICGETEGGGLPGWLQAGGPAPYGLVPRSGDPRFLAAVDAWFAVLLPLLRPFLYANGGPVVLAQVREGVHALMRREVCGGGART
jgi:beta-galactosidase